MTLFLASFICSCASSFNVFLLPETRDYRATARKLIDTATEPLLTSERTSIERSLSFIHQDKTSSSLFPIKAHKNKIFRQMKSKTPLLLVLAISFMTAISQTSRNLFLPYMKARYDISAKEVRSSPEVSNSDLILYRQLQSSGFAHVLR